MVETLKDQISRRSVSPGSLVFPTPSVNTRRARERHAFRRRRLTRRNSTQRAGIARVKELPFI